MPTDTSIDISQEEPKEEPKAKKPKASKAITVTPVYGPVYHPYAGIHINGPTLVEKDSWIEVQIEAGKLTC